MKTITFYSEKGGVGKSSLAIMMASWLKEKHGINTGVADFNHRIAGYRNKEIYIREKFIRENPGTDVKPFDINSAWPIVEAYSVDIDEYRKDGNPVPYASWFQDQILKKDLKGLDVVICDFPGSLVDGSFRDLLVMNQLGLVVIPTERDEMTLASTLQLHKMFGRATNKVNYCCFINKAQLGLQNFRKQYMKLAKLLVEKGLPMLPDFVTYSDRMSTIDKVDIIRSTFGFPDFTKPEYEGISDLGLNNLFIDVTKLLNRTEDIKGTAKVDLSFAESLVKKDDRKYFKGSSFPEFEIG